MARDRANINTAIWTDYDWRALTRDQQWLYTVILTHGDLSYAGVCDWRPGRLASFATGTTRDDVEQLGNDLQSMNFVLIDDDTEEIMIRSFIRHDGLLKQPKLSVSMVNAYGAIASNKLRAAFVHELNRMRDEQPGLKAFENSKVIDILKNPATPTHEFTHGFKEDVTHELTHSFTPRFTLNPAQALALPTATATTTSSKEDMGATQAPPTPTKKRASRITEDWKPKPETIESMNTECPHIDQGKELLKFIDYWNAKPGKDGTKINWDSTYKNWIRKAAEYNPAPTTPTSINAFNF